MKELHMAFPRALKLLPECLAPNLDLLGQHHNVSDLLFMAQHELDLANEGDIELSLKDRAAIERFLRWIKEEPDAASR